MPPDDYIATPVGEGLLLGRRHGHRLFALNETARFVWERRAEGVADALLASELAAAYGIEMATAARDVEAVLRHWRSEGLLDPIGPASSYVLGEFRLSFRVAPAPVRQALAPVFAPFAVDPDERARPDLSVEVTQRGNKYAVAAGQEASALFPTADAVVEEIMALIARHAFNAGDWQLCLHSAAVAGDDGCVLLPGQSGNGKTTLLANLLVRGSRHVTDDLALIGQGDFAVHPLPLALVLKRGSWADLESRIDGLKFSPVLRRAGQDVKYWLPPKDRIAHSVLPIKAIVFPRYAAGEAMVADRLSAYEAVAGMIQAPTRVGVPLADETVERLAGWAHTIPAYRVAYGRADEAAAWVEGLLRT